MWKKLLVVALAVCFMFVVNAMAEETGGANYTSPNGYADGLAEFLNEQDCIDHTHQFEQYDREDQAGIGVDLVVYQSENPKAVLEEVTIEEKYDFNNSENSVYAVARVNVFKLFKKNKEE